MAAFNFRFEHVLDLRRREEDTRQRELAVQLRKQHVLHDQLRQLQGEITRARHDLGTALVGAVDLSRVGQFTRFSAEGTLRGQQIVARLAQLDRQVADARAALNEAVRKRKALETLRERDETAWRLKQARREQAELDERAAAGFARGHGPADDDVPVSGDAA